MNPSTTTLDLNVGYPSVATICHAVQGDIQARIITANLYDGGVQWVPPSGAIGTIRFRTPLGTSGFYDTDEEGNTAVTWVGNVATLRIVQNAIAVAGDVPMQLSFYDSNGQVLTTFLWETLVQPSVLTDTQFMQTDYYNLLSRQINAVIGAAVYPPIINPTTRNWMLWDTETNSYVDSGYSSVGAKGDQGDQGVSITRIQRTSGTGEAGTNDTYTVYLSDGTTAGTFIVHNGSNGTNGLSIGRIEKTSGTGAAGTTDTYTVYLSNNTSVGTFTVYNGSDGEGSPGTQPPLMDGDQAAVGNANKYAREDHVHPRDSTLKAGIDDLEEIVGDGSLSGFTATNLTGAANELKGSLNTIPNPNLLDNWYFVGGGSQQGNGQFPINQRGQTSYSGSVYGIDRWVGQWTGDGTLTINSDSICLNRSGYDAWAVQRLRCNFPVATKMVVTIIAKTNTAGKTFDLYVQSCDGDDWSTVQLAFGTTLSFNTANTWELKTLSGTFPAGKNMVVCISGGKDYNLSIKAIKLELGDRQTLAHQENGVWVLNEIPNYQDELVKCWGSHADSSDPYTNYDYARAVLTQSFPIPSFASGSNFAEGIIRKSGNTVMIAGILQINSAFSANTLYATLPTELRPNSMINFNTVSTTTGKIYDVFIGGPSHGGLVIRQAVESGESLIIQITYLIG